MIKILFLAANPQATDRLQLDEEVRAIDQALRQAEFRDRFDLRPHWAVRVGDLQELLLRHQPHIVHFSGHGESSGEIILQTDTDAGQTVAPDALGNLFGILQADVAPDDVPHDNVRCVVLNACYSETQANAIAQHVDCVVGMRNAISDEAACNFSGAFYSALAYGRSVFIAFSLARNRIDLTSLPENDVPRLLAPRVDPQELYLVDAREVMADQEPAPGEPPYKGLHFFDQTDADLFFGRETLVAQLGGFLRKQPFLAVVGASGSGKSSVVQAGLVSALQRGEPLVDGTQPPEGSTLWPVHIITPNVHPLKQLSASLTRDGDSHLKQASLIDELAQDARVLDLCVSRLLSSEPANRLLLVVDQFEELFTMCRDSTERKAFVDNLLTAAAVDGVTTVIITLRADFYAHCSEFDNLRQALESQQKYIGPMTQEELRRAIEEPARLGGWNFESGLVDVLLADIGEEPGALPLLSHALLETWKRRRGHTLTYAGYYDAGGVKGAIAHTAETVFKRQLTPDQQAIAKNIFLRLTELGEGSEDTRRRVHKAELMPKPEEQDMIEIVLGTLADARLVTTHENEVEVAHEALIREWPTLTAWLDENRDGLRIHRRLSAIAQEWESLDRDRKELYRGVRLEQALEWERTHDVILTPLEREFLNISRDRAVRQQRLKQLVIGTGLAIVLIASVLLGWQRIRERQNDRAFDSLRAEASQFKEALKPEQAIEKLREANKIHSDRFDLELETEGVQRHVATTWLAEAEQLKADLQPEPAIANLKAAHELYPALFDLAPAIEDIKRYVATIWLQEGEKLAKDIDYEGASVKFWDAINLEPPPDTPIYIWIEGGEFMMGSANDNAFASSNEKPAHVVALNGYWIGRTEVTNAQYIRCIEARVCAPPDNYLFGDSAHANHPVTHVTWYQAKNYAEWVGGRLPTEAEWEKACRGAEGGIYPWGNTASTGELANYGYFVGTVKDVGSYPAGAYGLYDMAGNVWEWTADWFNSEYYGKSPLSNPPGSATGVYRVLRGGSWGYYGVDVRCPVRNPVDPAVIYGTVGFRVVVGSPGS